MRYDPYACSLLAITTPVPIQVDHSYNHHSPVRRRKDDPYLLSIMCSPFQRIFGVRPGSGVTFPFIDRPLLQDLLHLRFINMAAGHPAAGMFGKDQFAYPAVKTALPARAVTGWVVAAAVLPRLAPPRIPPVPFLLPWFNILTFA